MSLLSLQNIAAHYGASQALFDVSLEIAPGEALAVLGRNGMGKTTTVKVICRMLRHSGGAIAFDGRDISTLPSYRAARAGIGLVPEGRRCFPNLDVRENLLSAARPGPWTLDTVGTLFPRLAERQTQRAALLSGGEQQMLAIGRALMTNPRLLILDEATEGLAPVVRQEIWSVISRLKAESGLSFLVIDKSLKDLSRIADRAVILERGRSVWDGAFPELSHDITQRYLGV